MSHPYANLPESKFWKRAVSNVSVYDLQDIYIKKFDITRQDKISTAGSCFAQHIAKKLRAGGYSYLDVEQAPHLLPIASRQSFGYELYSARFGNIYTARQLLQLVQRATGEFTPKELYWEKDGRFFDPFRPTIEPNGFSSKEEFFAALDGHMEKIRELLTKTDIFIFTFGLTEGWINVEDGTTYPICPGTAAGRFDADKHKFINFTVRDVYDDMTAFMKLAQSFNPKMKFIFTVSPVPLVATASESHVLPATVYSKSVLRAAAGELQANFDNVDYFPSFEIVSGIPARSMFFNPDLRIVNQCGVDYVMTHFFKQHVPFDHKETVEVDATASRDVVCDEMLLEQMSRRNK